MPLAPLQKATSNGYNLDIQKIVARHERTSNATATSGGTEQPILRIDNIPLIGGCLYSIYTSPMYCSVSVANDVPRLSLRVNNAGVATITSNQIATAQLKVTSTTADECQQVAGHYVPGSNETLSVLLSTLRGGGTGAITIKGGTNAPNPIQLYVVNLGIDPGATGTNL